MISGEDKTHGVCVEDFWAKASSVSIEEFAFKGARNEDYSFDIQSFNPRICDGLHWSLLNQSAAILNLLKWSRRFVLSEDSQAESAIFQESVHQASSPNVRSMSNSAEIPTAQDEVIYWRFICSSWCCEEIWRLMLKPSSQWRLTRKSQLLFRGSLLGQLEKKVINQGGDCWVKNMVYTLLF